MVIPTVQIEPAFPPHVELTIKHNPFAAAYQTIGEWLAEREACEGIHFDWVSAEEHQKALDTESIWIIQWYPDTPVGFCSLAASTFEALMAKANEP